VAAALARANAQVPSSLDEARELSLSFTREVAEGQAQLAPAGKSGEGDPQRRPPRG
jgi:hypothetical protein